MKNLSCILILVAVTLITIVSSCKKGTANNPDGSLIGKWKLDANYVGTGGPVLWIAASTNDVHYVLFNVDGSLSGNMFPGYYSYTVKDSLLTFKYTADGVQKFIHTIRHDTLIMTPNGGPSICFEGCAMRFIKQ